jgi:hypothetical protein
LLDSVKRLPQPSCLQTYGWSPVCVRLCVVRLVVCEKRSPQPSCSQAYGCSPVCVRLCDVRWPVCEQR